MKHYEFVTSLQNFETKIPQQFVIFLERTCEKIRHVVLPVVAPAAAATAPFLAVDELAVPAEGPAPSRLGGGPGKSASRFLLTASRPVTGSWPGDRSGGRTRAGGWEGVLLAAGDVP